MEWVIQCLNPDWVGIFIQIITDVIVYNHQICDLKKFYLILIKMKK